MATRPAGDDEIAKRIEEMRRQLVARETRAAPVGTIHVNAHPLAVTAAQLLRAANRLQVTAADAAGDISGESVPTPLASGVGITAMSLSDPIRAEVRCGADADDLLLDETKVERRNGTTVVMSVEYESNPMLARAGCTLRVRVEDRDGNQSPWFVVK